MNKKYIIEITEQECYDILTLIDMCKNEGWYVGRKDYWDKHLDSVEYKLTKELKEIKL